MRCWPRHGMPTSQRLVETVQYMSCAFGVAYQRAGIQTALGTSGDALHDVVSESLLLGSACGPIDRPRFTARPDARIAVVPFAEGVNIP